MAESGTAEQIKPQESPAPAPEPEAAASPSSSLDDYDLGDSAFDPDLDLAPQPGKAEPEQPAGPARGPDGKFLPRKQETHDHPADLRDQALDFGMAQDEIDHLPTEQLRGAVRQLRRQFKEQAKENARQDYLASVKQPDQQATGQPLQEMIPEENDLGLDEESYDPGLMGVIKGLKKDLAETKAELKRVSTFQQARIQESHEEVFDRIMIADGRFGGLRSHDMDRASEEYIRREALWERVRKDNSNLPLPQKIHKWKKTLFGEVERAADNGVRQSSRQTTYSPEEWEEAGLAVPTQRAGSAEPKGDKKAMATAARLMRDLNMVDESDPPADSFL